MTEHIGPLGRTLFGHTPVYRNASDNAADILRKERERREREQDAADRLNAAWDHYINTDDEELDPLADGIAELSSDYRELKGAARRVVECWESGDLAGAVRDLALEIGADDD